MLLLLSCAFFSLYTLMEIFDVWHWKFTASGRCPWVCIQFFCLNFCLSYVGLIKDCTCQFCSSSSNLTSLFSFDNIQMKARPLLWIWKLRARGKWLQSSLFLVVDRRNLAKNYGLVLVLLLIVSFTRGIWFVGLESNWLHLMFICF